MQNRDDDIETDAALIKDTKHNMKIDLEKQINDYLFHKKTYGTAERVIRNLRKETFRDVIAEKNHRKQKATKVEE